MALKKKDWSCFQCNFAGTEKEVEDHKCPTQIINYCSEHLKYNCNCKTIKKPHRLSAIFPPPKYQKQLELLVYKIVRSLSLTKTEERIIKKIIKTI